MADITEISAFLSSVQSADKIIIVNTEKNRKTRYLLGITIEMQEDIIKSLLSTDYLKGPLPDDDPSKIGLVWVFIHMYNGTKFYIKIKEIEIIHDSKIAKCLSCHIEGMYD